MASAVSGGVALALVVLVAAVAYATQPPSLGVAEFAPAARQSLEAPPTTAGEETARQSSGRGRRAPSTTQAPTTVGPDQTGSTAGGPGTTTVSRTRSCFGNPPRQLPDPRAPACLTAIFGGDNGGSTTSGVTGTEIRVAWTGTDTKAARAIFEYFNRQFEFYGRRLVPVFFPNTAGYGTPTQQRSAAADVAAAKVFAALDESQAFWSPTYFHELARQRVVSVNWGAYQLLAERGLLDDDHPFLWTVQPSFEEVWRASADLICRSLAGKVARHAGGGLNTKTRVFGAVVAGRDRQPPVSAFRDSLAACGVTLVSSEAPLGGGSTAVRTALERLRDGGVTTLVCFCVDQRSDAIVSGARSLGWEDPELLMPLDTHPTFEEVNFQSIFSAAQRSRLFGIQRGLRIVPASALWWLNVAREVDPAVTLEDYQSAAAYEELLVLATGIQGAGPNLTPDSFAAALMTMQFPNAEVGQGPHWLPSVGFGPGDHSFYDDFALVWWSARPDAVVLGPYANPSGGSWCYLEGGARYVEGAFPADADARFFDPDERCR